MSFKTEIYPQFGIPLRTCDMAVDVFADGSARVGVPGQPAEGALFQFIHQPILVDCAADFAPPAGSEPHSAYLRGDVLDEEVGLGVSIAYGGVDYRVKYHCYDDFEMFAVHIGRESENRSFLAGIVQDIHYSTRCELKERGYVMQLVRNTC